VHAIADKEETKHRSDRAKKLAQQDLVGARSLAKKLLRPGALECGAAELETMIQHPDYEERIYTEFTPKVLVATTLKALMGDTSAQRLFFQERKLWAELQDGAVNIAAEPQLNTPLEFGPRSVEEEESQDSNASD
jgi:hypothetical protein